MEIPATWLPALTAADHDSLRKLETRLATEEKSGKEIYPPANLRYRALELVEPSHIRVVILGQDPYPAPGQAMGLAFSVPQGVEIPPSLRNIFQELKEDVGYEGGADGDLTPWAEKGVLLLNTALSVRRGEAGSHADYGWKPITAALLRYVSTTSPSSAFMLWGNHARAHRGLIDLKRHLVLEAGHPSPKSEKLFLGCKHFSTADEFLEGKGRGRLFGV